MSVTTDSRPVKTSSEPRLLAPAAYDETTLPALRLARSSRFARQVGKALLAVLLGSLVLVTVAPWQQSVRGSGNVIAYAPLERQQTIETPIKGRIVRLGEDLVENAHVVKGQLIAEISDIDGEYLGRLEEALTNAEAQVQAANLVKAATERSLSAGLGIVATYESQVESYEAIREQVIAAAAAAVESARNKVTAEEQELAERKAALEQIQADFERQRTLHDEQIVSQLKFQESSRKLKEAKAKVAKFEAYVESARNNLSEKESERNAKERKAQVDIEKTIAFLNKAKADVAKMEGEVSKSVSDLNKAQQYVLEMRTKVARQQNQQIVAPFDGFLTQISANNGSRILSEGDPICTIVPDTADRAVQVWLDGNDAPLVQPGRHVRLQFEGWPAVQFAGWPSVAVGTFGGEVVSVDATDDGKGKFRILVLPDETQVDWPNERFLRQGVRANGWVLLDKVPLWYEIWRNMNGFPPVVSTEEPKDKGKPPKLPKP